MHISENVKSLGTCCAFIFLLLTFESTGMAISIRMQVFSFFLSSSTTSGRFASIVRSVITGTSHITMVPLTFKTLSGICS